MSADNGIYILKTKDQYRVAHLQGIETASWSIIDGYWPYHSDKGYKYVPTRVVEIWGDSKFTGNEYKAFQIAHKWADSLPVCEYGVNVITYNKTWKHILEDAKKYAKKEIEFLKGQPISYYDLDKLQKIANGVYLDKWLHRKRNKIN